MDPGYVTTPYNLANSYLCQWRYEDALANWETVTRLAPEQLPFDLVAEARAGYAAGGERGFWKAYLEGPRSRPNVKARPYDMPPSLRPAREDRRGVRLDPRACVRAKRARDSDPDRSDVRPAALRSALEEGPGAAEAPVAVSVPTPR